MHESASQSETSGWVIEETVNEGVTLSYTRTGTGEKPLLVLCHGFGDNGRCWKRAAQRLTSQYDVVMPDARNHGESGGGPASLDELAGDILKIVQAVGARSAFVLAHSVGAISAAAFAARYPGYIDALVLEDPPWTNARPLDEQQRAKRGEQFNVYSERLKSLNDDELQAFGRKSHPSWHPEEFTDWATAKKQVRSDAMAQLDPGDWRDIVPEIACPTLLLHGDQENGCDGMLTPVLAKEMASMNTNLRVCHVPRAGHNLRREKFDAFLDAVREFLGGYSAS